MKQLAVLVLLLLPITAANTANSGVKVLKIPVRELTIEDKITMVLTDSMISTRVQRIILAQAKLESGNFKNSLSVKHNNIFGMHHSKWDPFSLGNLAKAEGCHCFASYSTVEDATRSYLRQIRRMKIPTTTRVTLDDFVSALKSARYFEADESQYRSTLHAILKTDSLYNH
jgi:flagellum-specific peptidoglycan hydrolase FlgJ